MKKKFLSILLSLTLAAALALTSLFAGCGLFKSPKYCNVTYDCIDGIRSIDVREYFCADIPQKHAEKPGYDFLGWYDSETDGNLYVDATGNGIIGITDDITLYQRYSPHEYTFNLVYPEDYPEETVNSFKTHHDGNLDGLPLNLEWEHMTFEGWYTQDMGQGKKVSSGSQVIDSMNAVTFENYDISDDNTVTLYAYFAVQTFNVTLKFDGYSDEILNVEYNTPVGAIRYETRDANGFGVTYWSLSKGGAAYSGNITQNITLYASGEWQPVIFFDFGGGRPEDGVYSIAVAENSPISLPVATKTNQKFMGWEDEEGNVVDWTQMPGQSCTLKARWQPQINFDSNGGTKVESLSMAAGLKLTLPTPTKEGFAFAGWYYENGEKFTEERMPLQGASLKAGWYGFTTVKIVLAGSGRYDIGTNGYHRDDYELDSDLTINLSKYLPEDFVGEVSIDGHFKLRHPSADLKWTRILYLKFYGSQLTTEDNVVLSKSFTTNVSEYVSFEYEATFTLHGNRIFCAYKYNANDTVNPSIADYYVNVTLPDTSYLIF